MMVIINLIFNNKANVQFNMILINNFCFFYLLQLFCLKEINFGMIKKFIFIFIEINET